MTAEDAMERINLILAHAWMVRQFLKHAEANARDKVEMKESKAERCEEQRVAERRIGEEESRHAEATERSGKTRQRLVIHPGTSRLALQKGIYKTWSPASWATLIENLTACEKFTIILAGGPDDEEIIGEITENLKRLGPLPSLICAYGVTKSLADLAAIIQLSDLIICVDSAPMHIAVGLNKPIVALFGPTDHGKLLPPDPKFKALSQAEQDSSDPGAKPPNGSPPGYQNGLLQPELDHVGRRDPGVQIPPEVVFAAVLTQIQKATDPKRSQEVGL